MKKFSYDGIGEVIATFASETEVTGGEVVKMTGNNTVGPCQDGDKFCGVALRPRAGMGGVRMKGFMTVGFTGELSLGASCLVADGQGGVRTGEKGVDAVVVSVDADEAVILV